MEAVRSRLRNHVHVCTRIPAISGVIARRLNFEFRNRIGIGNCKAADGHSFDSGVKAEPIVDDDAVLKERVLPVARPIHGNECCPFTNEAGVLNGSVGSSRVGEKIGVVPGAERKFRYRNGRCHRPESGAGRLNRFYRSLDLNRLGLCAHLQGSVQDGRLGHIHLNGLNL